MFVLFHRSVKDQDKRRQNTDNRCNSNDNTLRHNQSDVPAERQPHEAKRQESCNRRQTAAGKRRKRRLNRTRHRVTLILVIRFFLLIPPIQENRVVHRNPQLQHRRNRLGYVGNFAENDIASEII